MSNRDQEILRQLIKHRSLKEEELLAQFEISSRQLAYSVEVINEKLLEKNLPIIERRNSYYYAKNEAADYLTIHQSVQDIVFSKEDRVYLILIMILTRIEELSLDHFCIELQISKNTALTDIKKAKELLGKYHLSIEFSRKKGYVIVGEEWDKRIILFHTIIRIYKNYGDNVTIQLLESSQKYMDHVTNDVLKIEKFLGVKYTDEDFYPLIYFISSIFVRIERGQLIDSCRIDDREEIENTKEYQSLSYITTDFPDLPEDEKVYVINEILTKSDQSQLRQDVIKDVFQLDFDGVRSSAIVDILKQYFSVNKSIEAKIIEDLDSLLLGDRKTGQENEVSSSSEITDVVCEKHVLFVEEQLSWESILELSSQTLIKDNIVTDDYTEILKKEYKDQPTYIMLRQRIVLPHLAPMLVEQKLGVCILVLKQGILYQNERVHVVVLLTTPDKTSHLPILYHINRIAKDADFIDEIVEYGDSKKITKAIQNFSSELNET